MYKTGGFLVQNGGFFSTKRGVFLVQNGGIFSRKWGFFRIHQGEGGAKAKMTHNRADILHNPCRLRVPQCVYPNERGTKLEMVDNGQIAYITYAISGVPNAIKRGEGGGGQNQKWPTIVRRA